jgi:hypothetical protein
MVLSLEESVGEDDAKSKALATSFQLGFLCPFIAAKYFPQKPATCCHLLPLCCRQKRATKPL